MTRLNLILIVIVIIANNVIWFGYCQKAEYFSYVIGRAAEEERITLSYPVIGMGINKNFCVDGKMNVHEVKKTRNLQSRHLTMDLQRIFQRQNVSMGIKKDTLEETIVFNAMLFKH